MQDRHESEGMIRAASRVVGLQSEHEELLLGFAREGESSWIGYKSQAKEIIRLVPDPDALTAEVWNLIAAYTLLEKLTPSDCIAKLSIGNVAVRPSYQLQCEDMTVLFTWIPWRKDARPIVIDIAWQGTFVGRIYSSSDRLSQFISALGRVLDEEFGN